MERHGNQDGAVSLTLVTLSMMGKWLGGTRTVNARRALVRSVHALVTMAWKMAVALLDIPRAT